MRLMKEDEESIESIKESPRFGGLDDIGSTKS